MLDTSAGSLVGQQVNVGTGLVVGVTALAGQVAATVKYSSGGTLWIGGATLAAGSGYLVTSTEAVNIQASGIFYLTAAGATVVTYVLRSRSPSDPA